MGVLNSILTFGNDFSCFSAEVGVGLRSPNFAQKCIEIGLKVLKVPSVYFTIKIFFVLDKHRNIVSRVLLGAVKVVHF